MDLKEETVQRSVVQADGGKTGGEQKQKQNPETGGRSQALRLTCKPCFQGD